MPRARRTLRITLAAALTASLVLAACGDDDDDATDTTTEQAGSSDTAADTEGDGATTEAVTPVDDVADGGVEEGVVTLTAVDYAYEDVPASVPAGTTLALDNQSEEELHELVAIRIPDEETRSVEELVALPEEEIDAIFGAAPPATVLLMPPGGEQVAALGDGTVSEPGRYALVCFIPTGADPEEYMNAPPSEEGPPDVEGGPPHATQGMFAELTVE